MANTPNNTQNTELDLDLDLTLDDSPTTQSPSASTSPTPVASPAPSQTQIGKVVNPFAKNSIANQASADVAAKAKQNTERYVATQKVIPSKVALVLAILGILLALGGAGFGIFLLLTK